MLGTRSVIGQLDCLRPPLLGRLRGLHARRFAGIGLRRALSTGRETEEQLAAYRDQYGITFPILLDEGGVVIDQYSQDLFEVSPYPQDWVIGVDGKVAYVNTAYEIDEITAVIEAELAR